MYTKALIGSALVGLAFAAEAQTSYSQGSYQPGSYQQTTTYQNGAYQQSVEASQSAQNSVLPYPYAQTYQSGESRPAESYGYQTSFDGFLMPNNAGSAVGYAAPTAAFNPLAPLLASGPIALAYGVVVWVLAHIPALLLGSVATLGICKFTPICDKFSYYKNYEEFEEEVRSFATPSRLARAAEFVSNAVKKYQELQKAFVDTEKPEVKSK